MDQSSVVDRILVCIRSIKGIQDMFTLQEADRFRLLEIEARAEKKAFMGMGMCYNSGIREVLRCPVVILAITTMDFKWGCQSNMLLKKGDEVVGEEVRDPSRIEDLEKQANVSFLHKNFVIYKDKIDFPRDIIEKKCCFELPALTGGEALPGLQEFGDYLFCFPSTAGDVFLKKVYYEEKDEWGTGTVLFGFKEG
ncbi:MAG TPA: hypothetical protein VMC85_01915 [Desulfomonilaceae bacterium]|nr:hypothetical protein [Desulfomonilaceae bacterium]